MRQFQRPQAEAATPEGAQLRPCEVPGCDKPADHRAPRSPTDLRNYRWFCLDHVKEYNRAWNFFEGWSEDDIEQFRREDVTGHRPTWRFGSDLRADSRDRLDAVLRAFAREWFGDDDRTGTRERNGARERRGLPDGHLEALAVLDLEPPFSRADLKQRYKALVKKHHPDANGGSRESEELLKRINQAYNFLIKEIA